MWLTKAERAPGSPCPSSSVSHCAKWQKGKNIARVHAVPRKLKSRWPIAVRFAAMFPPMDAMSGVMVVPMLDPRTSAHERSKSIHPLLHMMRVMANVAALDCMTMVTMMPTNVNMSTEPNPMEV